MYKEKKIWQSPHSQNFQQKYAKLCQALDYRFIRIELLREALTRPNAVLEKHKDAAKRDYQVLEFVGDRVLNFVIANILIRNFSYFTIEELFLVETACISNQNILPTVAKQIDLSHYLIKGKGETIVTNKMLSDAMEAIFGAMYLDSCSVMPILNVINQFWDPHLSIVANRLTQVDLGNAEEEVSLDDSDDLLFCDNIDLSLDDFFISLIEDDSHFDSGVYKFRKKVLNWDLEDIKTPFYLSEEHILSKQFSYYDASIRQIYFKRFKRLILEEARAVLSQGLELVSLGKADTVHLTLMSFKKAKNSQNPSLFRMRGKLPIDFDYGYSSIALLLESALLNSDIRLLGLASYNENEEGNKFEIKSIVTDEEFELQSKAFEAEVKWKASILGSLVPHMRMYDVCTQMPKVDFEKQIILGSVTYPEETLPGIAKFVALSKEKDFLKLNSSQREAVEEFLSIESGLQLLQGPPGTGKTTTIAVLLKILSQQQGRILVCAPSNKAVQVLAKKFLEMAPDVPMILAGVKSKLSLELREIFLHTWSRDICGQIGECMNILQNLQGHMTEPKKIEKKFFFGNLKEMIKTLKRVFHKINRSLPDFSRDCHWQAIFKAIESLITLRNETISKIKFCSTAKLPIDIIYNKLTKILDRLNDLDQTSKRRPVSQLEKFLLNNAKVIFSTLCVSGRRAFQEMSKVETLIVDEAGQAIEPEVLIPFTLSPKKCLLVGDTKQLPATVLSQAAIGCNLHWSLLWRLLEECEGNAYSILKTQYRMHPEIRYWPSQQYYHNLLEDDKQVLARATPVLKGLPKIFGPCAFINVQSSGEKKYRHSYINEAEAAHILKLLYYLQTYRTVDVQKQVGIIVFYAAQAEYIKRRFQKTPWRDRVKVHTVDGYQGEECDFIIVSFVRSNSKGQIGFLRDFRRLNVAITRARISLIMLGNIETLTRKKSDVSLLIQAMQQRKLLFPEAVLVRAIKQANPQYQAKSCRFFAAGNCRAGDKCHFVHSKGELNPQHDRVGGILNLKNKLLGLARKLNYIFKRPELLREALTRQSAIEEKLSAATERNHEYLKFLGNRMLNLAIARMLVCRYPQYNEGKLHQLYTACLSKEEILVKIAEEIRLGDYLIKGLGESNITAKMYSDGLKAIFGAMCLDSNSTVVANLIGKLWAPYLSSVATELLPESILAPSI